MTNFSILTDQINEFKKILLVVWYNWIYHLVITAIALYNFANLAIAKFNFELLLLQINFLMQNLVSESNNAPPKHFSWLLIELNT